MPVRVPSASGSASTAGACSTSTSGANDRSSAAAGVMNIVFANSAWYGLPVTTRTPMRWAWSAPAKASTT